MEEQARSVYCENAGSMRICNLLCFNGFDMESETSAADEEGAEGGVWDVERCFGQILEEICAVLHQI